MWDATKIKAVVTRTPVLVGAASLLAGGVGATLGYRVAGKKLEAKYQEISDREIAEAKDFYARLNKTSPEGEVLTPQQVAEDRLGKDAAEALRNYSGIVAETPAASEDELISEEVVVEKTTVTSRNVFTSSDDEQPVEETYEGWDYETELARRNGDAPYIISEEEYLSDEKGYDQIPLTYYEEDDILVDDKDDVIPDSDIIGDENLVRFGHGTRDKNGLFIRNDELEAEFEIKRSKGSYRREVLGFIEHSHKPQLRKFRGHDD